MSESRGKGFDFIVFDEYTEQIDPRTFTQWVCTFCERYVWNGLMKCPHCGNGR